MGYLRPFLGPSVVISKSVVLIGDDAAGFEVCAWVCLCVLVGLHVCRYCVWISSKHAFVRGLTHTLLHPTRTRTHAHTHAHTHDHTCTTRNHACYPILMKRCKQANQNKYFMHEQTIDVSLSGKPDGSAHTHTHNHNAHTQCSLAFPQIG